MQRILALFFIALFATFSASTALPLSRLTRKGEATFYTTGLGSCGKTSRNNEMVAALSGLLMLSGNYCGRKIRASSQHGSVMLKVVDTCPACAPGDIDMSPAAFRKLAKLDEGRIPISWQFV